MKIEYNISDQMHNLIEDAVNSDAAKKGFGTTPNYNQFLNGIIYYWIRKNSPELIDHKDNIPEIIEHKTLKG